MGVSSEETRYFSPLNKQTRERSTPLPECPRKLARKLCHPSSGLLCSLERIVLCSLIISMCRILIFLSVPLLIFIPLFQVTNAQKYGAKAILIYNDPQDSAPVADEDLYPHGWWLPRSGVQRGSILLGTGDPLTPRYPSKGTAEMFCLINCFMILEIFIIATITLAFQSSLTTELCITIVALLIKIKYYESDIRGIYTFFDTGHYQV